MNMRICLIGYLIFITLLSNAQSPVPEARSGHKMVFDQARQIVILFGGWSAIKGFLGDTWTWNGEQWQKVCDTGPSPRSWYGMAYDTDQGKIVLFGGRDSTGSQSMSDMWEWNGNNWKETTIKDGPEARDHFAMTYDQVRKRIVLHGGYDVKRNFDFADTWEWDGQTWIQQATSGPPMRGAHVMAFDERMQKVLMFGGIDSSQTVFGGTWTWEGNEWRLLPIQEVEGRTHTSLVYNSKDAVLVRFGGKNESRTPFGDTWMLNGTGWEQLNVTGPPARIDHGAAYDCKRMRMVLFGGKLPNPSKQQFDDTWEWNGRSWTKR